MVEENEMLLGIKEKRPDRATRTTQKNLKISKGKNIINHIGDKDVDDSFIEPVSIGEVYTELSKQHLMSLLGQKTPTVRLITLDFLVDEISIEIESLEGLGIGILNPADPKDEVASCILIGKIAIVPTVEDKFGIITEDKDVYLILCDVIIDTEAEDIPIKRVQQLS